MVKIGDVVEGRYRILRTLGQGGMGTVFLAEHALIKRKVAIKILHADLAADAAAIDRFMTEANTAGTLGQANLVESTDMGTTGGVPYIVFEFLEGVLLTDEIYRVGGLPVRRALRIADQVTSALAAAHSAGIVHRDLTSDNIFLTDKDDALDHVKILGFGQRHVTMGTPEFMAPEQIDAAAYVDKRADIYALGVILYEMLTARRPFSNEDDPRELLHRIASYPPPPLQRPEVPQGLEAVIDILLAKNPNDRYQSMAEVKAALEPFTRDTARDSVPIARPSHVMDTPLMLPVVAAPAAKPYPLYALAGCGILVGALGLAFGLRGHTVEKAPAPVAQPAAAVPVARQVAKIDVTLEADAPNARVVFRRRVAAAPATMMIAATDVVELVEVSAPGYKTQRYWLTFDRPTHLKAHLAKGSGMAEATEEETLVALGEVAAPQVVAAAAPAAAPGAMTVRKIGRAAAEEAPAPETPEAPAIEVTTEAPAAEPAPAPADPVAAVELPKPADVPAAPAPVQEPEQPVIDKATMSTVVGAHRPEVLKCFADGKKADRAMKGTLDLQLAVDAAGKVKHIQVQSTLNNPLVAACVVRSANAWQFPARDGGDLATANYPFTIN